MFDIGAMELFVVATLALVVVGPKELPKLLRTVSGFIRKMRELAADFRSGVEDLASEVEKEVDPFADLRKQEGLRPGMSPSEITEHILANRGEENSIASPAQNAAAQQKIDQKTADSGSKNANSGEKNADSGKKTEKSTKASAKKATQKAPIKKAAVKKSATKQTKASPKKTPTKKPQKAKNDEVSS